MTADAWQKCGNVRYAITYIWANQKSKSFEYHWLRALAMVWRNELFPPLCRASDVIWRNPSNHGWLTTNALPNVTEQWTEHHVVTAYKASHHCMEADYSQGLRERAAPCPCHQGGSSIYQLTSHPISVHSISTINLLFNCRKSLWSLHSVTSLRHLFDQTPDLHTDRPWL